YGHHGERPSKENSVERTTVKRLEGSWFVLRCSTGPSVPGYLLLKMMQCSEINAGEILRRYCRGSVRFGPEGERLPCRVVWRLPRCLAAARDVRTSTHCASAACARRSRLSPST